MNTKNSHLRIRSLSRVFNGKSMRGSRLLHTFQSSTVLLIGMLSFGFWYAPVVFAATVPPQVYELQLVYNPLKGVIAIDKGAQQPYLLLSGTTSFPTSPRFSEYFGSVSSVRGETLLEFGFSRPPVVETGAPAPLLLRVPYFPNATRINLYRGSSIFLSIDVSPSLVCRENTQCERDIGETPDNCPTDCEPLPTLSPTPKSVVPIATSSGTITPGAEPPNGVESMDPVPKSDAFQYISLLFLFLGVASFGSWIYLGRRNRH